MTTTTAATVPAAPSFHKGQKVQFQIASKAGMSSPIIGVFDHAGDRGRVAVVSAGREFKPFAKHVKPLH